MFKRIGNLIRGFFGMFISGMEKQNPEALLELESENLRTQVGQYNQGLASHAGLCERLMTQIRKLEADNKDLRAKTAAHLKVGNRDAAGQYALRLQTVDRELTENRTQLEQAETTYRDLVKARDIAVQSARQKIESLRSSISDMKMKKALADQALADFAAKEGIVLDPVPGSLGGISNTAVGEGPSKTMGPGAKESV